MRKYFAAFALAMLTVLAVPTAANADELYPPTTPPTTTTVLCDVDPASGSSAASSAGSASECQTVSSVRSADLAATGMSDAVLPIAAGGGILALLGAALVFARRRPVRN